MAKCRKSLELMRRLEGHLRSQVAIERGRVKETAFTRQRKLSFCTVVGMLLNSLTRSLQIELDDFFEYVLDSRESVTKQAFSKARQNVKPEFLRELAHMPADVLYRDGEFKTHCGHRLLAVDGSTLELPDFEHLREHFDHVGNAVQTVRARASAMFDLENGIILDAQIDNYRLDERTFMWRHLACLKESGYRRDLLLYDRGYPSRKLIAYHIDEGIDFVMRVKDSFLSRKKVYRGEEDYHQDFMWNGNRYAVRRVVFQLDSGEIETLITSLPDRFSLLHLKEIYAKRWGVETGFYELKHKIQIENFSGYTVSSVIQDFFATICLHNIAAIFIHDSLGVTNQKRKYTYKPNKNILTGKLKNRLVKALLTGGDAAAERFVRNIQACILRNMIPIRPDRVVSRGKSRRGIKYPPNMKHTV